MPKITRALAALAIAAAPFSTTGTFVSAPKGNGAWASPASVKLELLRRTTTGIVRLANARGVGASAGARAGAGAGAGAAGGGAGGGGGRTTVVEFQRGGVSVVL